MSLKAKPRSKTGVLQPKEANLQRNEEHLGLKGQTRKQHRKKDKVDRPRCKQCGKCFTLLEDLNRHMLVHTRGEKTFACQYCGKGFPTRSNCNRHERSRIQVMRLGRILRQNHVRKLGYYSRKKQTCNGMKNILV